MVEGTDIRDITRESLRTSYGMVLQDTWLRSGTIRDNITMGREGFSDEQIIGYDKKRLIPTALLKKCQRDSTHILQKMEQE